MKTKINLKNKKAYFDYTIIKEYISGVCLVGTEVKSIRESKLSFTDSYCYFLNNELYIKNFFISKYKEGSYNNHEEKRDRKLLLKKVELSKIRSKLDEKGMSLIPLNIFIDERGFIKFKIGLCKGKKNYDKRNSIKEKDLKRNNEISTKY